MVGRLEGGGSMVGGVIVEKGGRLEVWNEAVFPSPVFLVPFDSQQTFALDGDAQCRLVRGRLIHTGQGSQQDCFLCKALPWKGMPDPGLTEAGRSGLGEGLDPIPCTMYIEFLSLHCIHMCLYRFTCVYCIHAAKHVAPDPWLV